MTNASGWMCLVSGVVLSVCLGAAAAASPQAGETPPLSPRALLSLAPLGPDAFLRAWSERREQALAALPADAPAAQREGIALQWSAGVIDYPYFHWRESGGRIPADWRPRLEAVRDLPVQEADAIRSDDGRRLVAAWLHDVAWRAQASDPQYRTGDNRALRARIDAIVARGMPREIARDLVGGELATHVDENGARSIDAQIDAFAALGGDPDKVAEFRKAAAEEDAVDATRPRYAYRTVDGIPLYLHASRVRDTQPRPVLLWFHGGSGETGHWSYCPAFCRQAESLGMLVLQVEYRTAQRFSATPIEGREDAETALAWVKRHADEIGADRAGIVVAGFSTGGSMASQLALSAPRDVRAAMVMSDCFRPGDDAWYRRALADAGRREWPAQVAQLRKGSPPLLMFHARDDEMCPYAHAVEMAERARALGQGSRLVTIDGGGHFFVFAQPVARETVKREAAAFLTDLHLVTLPAARTE